MADRTCTRCKEHKADDQFDPRRNICRECRRKYVLDWRHARGESKSFRGSPSENLVGQTYDMLTVMSQVEGRDRGQFLWLCRCSCGNEKVFRTGVIKGGQQSCGCIIHRRKSQSHNWKGRGELSAVRWNLIKNKAKKRGLEFSVSLDYLWGIYQKQGGLCALTGVPIDLGTFKDDYGMASLDRIDSTGGYTEGNVQWVHRTVNFMKQSLSDAELVQWCRRVVGFADRPASVSST